MKFSLITKMVKLKWYEKWFSMSVAGNFINNTSGYTLNGIQFLTQVLAADMNKELQYSKWDLIIAMYDSWVIVSARVEWLVQMFWEVHDIYRRHCQYVVPR